MSMGMDETIEWYEKNAQEYHEKAVLMCAPEQIAAFEALLPRGSHVLDAGCGSGRDSVTLKESGFDVVGIDLTKSFIEIA